MLHVLRFSFQSNLIQLHTLLVHDKTFSFSSRAVISKPHNDTGSSSQSFSSASADDAVLCDCRGHTVGCSEGRIVPLQLQGGRQVPWPQRQFSYPVHRFLFQKEKKSQCMILLFFHPLPQYFQPRKATNFISGLHDAVNIRKEAQNRKREGVRISQPNQIY